jgi:hypothetical protein
MVVKSSKKTVSNVYIHDKIDVAPYGKNMTKSYLQKILLVITSLTLTKINIIQLPVVRTD